MENNSSPRSSFRDLPADVLLALFSFLTPKDWCLGAGLACKAWLTVAEEDALWAPACRSLWDGKANVEVGMPFPYARFDSSVGFSIKELKYLLGARGVDTNVLIEKSEFKSALETSNILLRTRGPSLRGKWRASYAYSILDSRRTYITDKELCGMQWSFFFKSNPMEFTSEARFEIDKVTRQPRFTMNPWPMHHVSQLPWRRNDRGDIVIHNFPGHVIFRLDDWSFGMENEHVVFFQANTPGFSIEETREDLLNALDFEAD